MAVICETDPKEEVGVVGKRVNMVLGLERLKGLIWPGKMNE